jgi:ABC-type glycerol-3-phosphate transport system permease component
MIRLATVAAVPRRRVQPSRYLWYLPLAAAVVIMALPLVWMAATALKSPGEVMNLQGSFLPAVPQWQNLTAAWDGAPFGRFFLNSAIFSFGATAGQVMTSAMSGYVFARMRFPAKGLLFYLTLAGLMVPFAVVMVPVVEIVNALGWTNTYQGLLVPNLQSALGMFLFRQYYLGIPRELDEAARVDGANRLAVFVRVALPLAGPIMAAFGILAFLTNWNNFLYPLLVTTTTKMMVLPVGLAVFEAQFNTQYNILMAASVIAVVPVFLVSLAVQRYIVSGITLGSFR